MTGPVTLPAPDVLAAMNDAIKAIDAVFGTRNMLSMEASEDLAAAREQLREALGVPASLLRTHEELYGSLPCPACARAGWGSLISGHFPNCTVLDFRARLRKADDVLRRLSVKSVQAYIEKWCRNDCVPGDWGGLAQQIVLALKGEHEGGV